MKSYILFLLLMCSWLFYSCTQGALSENENKSIKEEVRNTLTNYYSDIKKSGLTAEFNYLDNSKDFFWVPPGFTAALSYDSVAAILKKNAKLFSSVDNTFDTLIIKPLSKDIATYTCRLRSSMTMINGKSSNMTMLETGTMVKRQNGWKLLCGQTAILNKPTE